MTTIEQARAIARAICVEYRLSPELYEASGGEHPLIPVIVHHVAPVLENRIHRASFDAGFTAGFADCNAAWNYPMPRKPRAEAWAAFQALSKLDQQEGA